MVYVDGRSRVHHECMRCGAQKDTPDTPPYNKWPGGSGRKKVV